jgi:hypothetical protein
MANRFSLLRFFLLTMVLILSGAFSLFAQEQFPQLGPPLKPLIKLIGYLNAPVSPTNTYPVLTIALSGDEKRYTFLLTDMRIMAGPLRTPGDILSEVKPYSTNFYLRAPREVLAQLSDTAPTEQVSILAEYSRADRVLLVQSIEKSGQLQK